MAKSLSISNKSKAKSGTHSHGKRDTNVENDDTEQHNDDVIITTTKKVWCDGCKELETNRNYQEPSDMCASCFYPIPRDQSKKKDDSANVCPRCGCGFFVPYIENPTVEQMTEIRKVLEGQKVEQ